MRKDVPFFLWLLPLFWGVCSYVHHSYPGDENAMWLLSSAAGLWIAPFAFLGSASKAAIALFIAFAGAVVMSAIGFVMDRFHISRALWITLFLMSALAIFGAAILSYPSIERAISKNGSWWAYILFSINIGVYVSIILSVILRGILRVRAHCKRSAGEDF
ncbi:MAG: hypothetical protein JSU70_19365 [Phycisphaerales bacterium]|nr:MAG: hypothetical protein JSU70_19365 [Phycisphaerales bacterium]